MDYSETFSPVANITSIRLCIALAAGFNWKLHQLDIKNAFHHGDRNEERYMVQPLGFIAQGEDKTVCKLRKILYGLKQSPRAWFGKFSQTLEIFGINKCKSDHSVFHKTSKQGIILLVVHMDDIVITENDEEGITSLKQFIHTHLQTKDLGELKYFLGVEVIRSNNGIFLCQRKYILDLLTETGKLGVKPQTTLLIPNFKLLPDEELFDNLGRYRRLVGKLNYLTITRPDVSFTVSIVSQYMSTPSKQH